MDIFGRRYDTGEAICLTLSGETVGAVTSLPIEQAKNDLPIIAPAFFDMQINGYGGTWFGQPELTPEQVLETLKPHFGFGVTRMFPTLITNSNENLLNGFRAIREACEQESWADHLVAGCHLEGPYLSAEDGPRGAHPLEHIRPANWDEFQRWQEASGGRIRLITIAPEQENAIPFIKQAVKSGVVISIGHTAAQPDDIQRAVEAGATMSTHLGNGAHGMIRRHPNYIWEQLAEDRLVSGLITDGHHLPKSVVKCMVRAKGVEHCIITCDASGLAGCPPGIYHEENLDVEILEDGRVVVAGQRQYLAGSGANTLQCVQWASQLPDIGLKNACDMAGNWVARCFGDPEVLFEPGRIAEFIILETPASEGKIHLNTTITHGEICFQAGSC